VVGAIASTVPPLSGVGGCGTSVIRPSPETDEINDDFADKAL
jgi:hypothetical protein